MTYPDADYQASECPASEEDSSSRFTGARVDLGTDKEACEGIRSCRSQRYGQNKNNHDSSRRISELG